MAPVDVVVLCPPGFEDIVAEAAARELPKCVVSVRTSGFVRVRTDASVQRLRAFRCATNVFAVINEVPRTAIDREAHSLRERLSTTPLPSDLPGRGTLRLRIQDDGQFAPTTSRAAVALAEALGSWSQLGVSGRGASLDIWLIRRSAMRSSILATRLSGGSHRERGRLRPEICAALARVEPLAGAQLVMDPFAGSGVIGDACLEAGAKSVWLNDLDAKGARRAERPGAKWTSADFRKLRVPAQSVDAVVTDPPWGRNWKVRHGVGHLYRDFGSAAQAWLRPGGALVLLTGAPDAAVELMLEAGKLRSELVLPVLVNGSKATVIRARKGRRRRRG